MRFHLTTTIERWPVAGAFVIARGAKTCVDVLLVEIHDGDHVGRGEGTPIYYGGETVESCRAQVNSLPDRFTRAELQKLLPAGAARNAVDCALWNLDAQKHGLPLWQMAGLAYPRPLVTAMTVSIADPDVMEADARRLSTLTALIKVKLAGAGDLERLAAVRRGAPQARLVVDANESWTGRDIAAAARALVPFGVELIEQPVRKGDDHLLDGVASPIPFGADESCHDRADLPRLAGRYQAINIKLDKAGGLTEALALKAAAQAMGFRIMVGCMLSTSLGIAPAFLVAQDVDWADLDGALLLAEDRAERLVLNAGLFGYSNLVC